MADISATPSSEMTNLITDYSGDPVTLDDNLGLRPRARAVSGLRPCARAFSRSAPRLASVKASSRATLECQLLPPRAAFGLARTGVAIYGTSPTPSASVLGGASEFGRLCYPSHTLHTVY